MIKVAACQLLPEAEGNARKKQLQAWLAKADAEHVDFVCFPEGFLTGYYPEEALARENALEVGDSSFCEWLDIFSKFSSTIVVGFNEQQGDQLFDSAAIVEHGKLLGIQRKHYLYHDYFTPGTSFIPFRSKGIIFGVVICRDTIYFEPSRVLALQGASLLFSPMCNRVLPSHPYATRPPYYSHFVARSFENQCWLVSADWIWHEGISSTCPGHSVVYDCDGKELARSQEGQEELLIYNIPIERLKHEKGLRVHGSSLLVQELSKQ